jgi:ketosteroid isomerase-like protein
VLSHEARGPASDSSVARPATIPAIMPAMSEESATPDLLELVRRSVEAVNRRDLDQLSRSFGGDSVWDLSPMGLGTYEGASAIRVFLEEWMGGFELFELMLEEVLDLGNDVVFAVVTQRARPCDSTAELRMRYSSVNSRAGDVFERITNYADVEEGRVAAERLAEERRSATSQQNVEIVRSIYEAFARRDSITPFRFYAADIEWDVTGVELEGVVYRGHEGVRSSFRSLLAEFRDFEFQPVEFTACADQVLVKVEEHGVGRGSGVVVRRREYAVWTLRDGLVLRMRAFLDHAQALQAAGLVE